jgi:ABC-type nickel/cobalt efflux system permease component RcnA/ABC-type uncharacterized transport system substrate-binding protein
VIRFLLILACLVIGAAPAAAHPHIFIDAKTTIVFDDQGAVAGFRHAWTFDEGMSAWWMQGLDTDGDGKVTTEESHDLALENMSGLKDYSYYTFAGEDRDLNLALETGRNPVFSFDGPRATLTFDLPLAQPYKMRAMLEVVVDDPEYYVAITYPDASAVSLENAPEGCGVMLREPRELSPELEQQLYALPPEVTELPPELAAAVRGTQGAIVVSCAPGAAPAETAVDAATAMAETQPPVMQDARPFGGPPPEPGLPIPRTGPLGWIAQLQADFYLGLQDALAQLKTDWTAFWVLGGLSFLYGIFHAAGPGHGKVVISSYVLANEHQLRRGIALSFVSAFVQSLVAIAFVLIAAAVLNLASTTMNDAANWIGIASYALVMLLGAYLIVRHVFFGHRHHQAPVDKAALARRHLHDDHDHDHHDHDPDEHEDDHAHAITPQLLRSDWREQAAVVLGVGLRPCTGALVVLVFALSQGLLLAGIAAVLLMGLGTGITVAILATIAATAKGWAGRIGGARSGIGSTIVWWLELLGAIAVFGFGLLFLLASL